MKNTWLFPLVQSLHVVGLGLLVGTIALNDYRVLRGKPEEHLGRWSISGLLLMIATGIAMFWSDAARYLSNPAFQLKMVLVVAGIAFQFLRKPSRWASIASLTLWTSAVVASRLVEDFDK